MDVSHNHSQNTTSKSYSFQGHNLLLHTRNLNNATILLNRNLWNCIFRDSQS